MANLPVTRVKNLPEIVVANATDLSRRQVLFTLDNALFLKQKEILDINQRLVMGRLVVINEDKVGMSQ